MGLHEEHEVGGDVSLPRLSCDKSPRSETIERHDADVDVDVDGTSYRAAGSVLALLSQFQT
jgi:hypothetical protein